MDQLIRRLVVHVNERLTLRSARSVATVITVAIASTNLAGCAVEQASNTSFVDEFVGTFTIADSSNDPGAHEKTLKITALRANLLVLSIDTEPDLDLFNCSSLIVNESHSLGNGEGQDSVHELICDDNRGWRWFLQHGAPGLVATPALFNRVLPHFHTISSSAGYIFHRGFPNGLPRDYALQPSN